VAAGLTAPRPLAGRFAELRDVVGLVQGAARGEAAAMVVAGEAGVGKTALLRDAGRQSAHLADVLWASCLPLSSLTAPYLPLRSAIRDWNVQHDVPGPESVDGLMALDGWLDSLCRRRPVVLVVDDVQWADQSSLDALMYVLAGPARRRLAVLATVRTGEAGDGHPLRRWLADVRRLPRVEELQLGRLDRPATVEQIAGILGRPPRQSLVDEVYARTRGNAYLTGLLVRAVSPDTAHLPARLPDDLRDAVTRAWHGLTPAGRALMRLVAVAGRPQDAEQLSAAVAEIGDGGAVVPLVREAVDGGVLEAGPDARYWFVHPLLAEVLEEGLLPEEKRGLHLSFATLLVRAAGPAPTSMETVDIADHFDRANRPAEAFDWALRAADALAGEGGSTEMMRLLRRALQLWPSSGAGVSRLDLLDRIRLSAERAGDQDEELAAIEELVSGLDRDREPLRVAALLVRRMILRNATSREFASLTDTREALRLAQGHPGSAEYAWAMAELAHAELWRLDDRGAARAVEAVSLARACGSRRALASALTARAMSRALAGEIGTGGFEEARQAQQLAGEDGEFFAFAHATFWAANCTDSAFSPGVLAWLADSRRRMTALGAPHTYVAMLCAAEADGNLMLGDWRACVQRLREVLGAPPGQFADSGARLTAALLAAWQGRQAEARGHLARAEELYDEAPEHFTSTFEPVRAELALAAGDPAEAIAVAWPGLSDPGRAYTTLCERLVPLIARALADQAQQARDLRQDDSEAVARLREFRLRHPRVIVDNQTFALVLLQNQAMQLLYDAEVKRGLLDPDAAAAWIRASDACEAGLLAWDHAYTRWRAAEALLVAPSTREAGAAALRRAHELAVELAAAPLLAGIEALARHARVSLATVRSEPLRERGPIGWEDLTARETEILGHVVAGRTYREIARDLVISEKTVSVHISNLLRKTGAANRVHLAQLARRLTPSP
jgi:DNA-binding CsgD family transcriptional regulator